MTLLVEYCSAFVTSMKNHLKSVGSSWTMSTLSQRSLMNLTMLVSDQFKQVGVKMGNTQSGSNECILSKFGAYAGNLFALSEESSTKPADRAKLCGYLKMWLNAKYLLGCMFFMNLLSVAMLHLFEGDAGRLPGHPCSILKSSVDSKGVKEA